ncbi:DNA primase [bacterium]|nr:DNA primase [bacterium]MBU1881263.1 DNA primase [bacterium]
MPGLIPHDIIERIREATDIVDLISEYVRLDKKGGNFFGLCPFHPEKTPSFSVHPGKQIFHCFGCGLGGNVFTFLQEHDKLSFVEAARELAKRSHIDIPEEKQADPERQEKYDALYKANEFACDFFSRCLWEGKGEEYAKVREYLKDRGISRELTEQFRLGYAPDSWDGLVKGIRRFSDKAPDVRFFIEAGLLQKGDNRVYDRFKGRLMFPIMNLSGRPIAFGGRTLSKEKDVAKYINTQQTALYNKSQILYGLHLAREQIRRKGECLVVEGYTDLMRLHEGGFSHSVASSGTALTVDHARILRRFCQKVVLVFDGDAAGSHAALRGGDVLLAAGLDARVIGLPEGQDPDSFVKEQGAGAFGDLIDEAQDLIAFRINLYRREGRLVDTPSRTNVARELLGTIAVIPDAIRQELTAQDAAKKIGVAAETMLRELRRTSTRGRVQVDKNEKRQDPFGDFPVKERGLIEALIRWPELRAATFTEITSDDFRYESLRNIAKRMEELWIKGKAPSGEELLAEDVERKETSFITYALSQFEALTDPDIDAKAKRKYDDFLVARDCLRSIIAQRLTNEEATLKAELSQKTEIEDILTIQKQQKAIRQREKEINQKEFWQIPPHPSIDVPQDHLWEIISKFKD